MVTWDAFVFGVVAMSAVSSFSLVSVSHISAGWRLRTHFEMAVRSPQLLTICGAAGVFLSCGNVSEIILFGVTEPGTTQLFFLPMSVIFSTSSYVLRGIRLLVMYNPSLRERYGAFIKEIAMVKALMISFVVVEALVWSLGLALGLRRIASFAMIVVVMDVLLTIGATLAFIAKLRTTNDLFDMSLEIKSVGACLLGALALIVIYLTAPAYFQGHVAVTAMFFKFLVPMWISNIQPVRNLLSRRVGGGENIVPWFPYVPWRTPYSKIVVGSGRSTRSRAEPVQSSGIDDWLDLIMDFPPLLLVFKEYCRKALCSESLLFLIDVSEFSGSHEAATADNDKAMHFGRFQAVVNKYVKDGAPFEINISFKTKAAVLKAANSASFRHLTLDEMSQVLAPAAKEVRDMLKANLYNKFCTTEEYRQFAGHF